MAPPNILAAAKSAERTAEEKLARDFHVLFRDVSGKILTHTLHLFWTEFSYFTICNTHSSKMNCNFSVLVFPEAFNRLGMPPVKEISPSSTVTEAEVMDITLSTDEVQISTIKSDLINKVLGLVMKHT